MQVVMTVHTLTEHTFYGVEVEIPDSVVAKGEKAVTRWMNRNISVVDAASMRAINHESNQVRKVEGYEVKSDQR